MSRSFMTLLITSCLAVAAPLPKELRVPDHELFIAKWKMPVSMCGNKQHPKADWTFQADDDETKTKEAGWIYLKMISSSSNTNWQIRINPKAEPKQIDIGNYAGIYVFEGKKLKIAYFLTRERPKHFDPEDHKYYSELVQE